MLIGERLRAIRESKNMSQGDIEERTGLIRAYVSRVENGHTVPSLETLEKFSNAFDVPLYQIFYDGNEEPRMTNLGKRRSADDIVWGAHGKEQKMFNRLRILLPRIPARDRELLLAAAQMFSTRGSKS
jgi:transcriptional regulator with XRE-family HTH domain